MNSHSNPGCQGSLSTMTESMDEACASCNQQRPYASATRLTKLGNDMEVTQTSQTFTSTSLIFYSNQTHSFATTYYCIQLSTFIELLYYIFLSTTPLRLWGSVGYKHIVVVCLLIT